MLRIVENSLLSANILHQDGRLLIAGDLNFATVPLLWQQSLSLLAQCKQLDFDLSQVVSSNSAGLALLIEWFKYAKQHHQAICFSHVPAQLASIIQVANLADVLKTITEPRP